MIIETIQHDDGSKTQVIVHFKREPTTYLAPGGNIKNVKYLLWEIGGTDNRIKIKLEITWQRKVLKLPPFPLGFFMHAKTEIKTWTQTYWAHENEISFYTFQQYQCKNK